MQLGMHLHMYTTNTRIIVLQHTLFKGPSPGSHKHVLCMHRHNTNWNIWPTVYIPLPSLFLLLFGDIFTLKQTFQAWVTFSSKYLFFVWAFRPGLHRSSSAHAASLPFATAWVYFPAYSARLVCVLHVFQECVHDKMCAWSASVKCSLGAATTVTFFQPHNKVVWEMGCICELSRSVNIIF